MLCVLAKPIVVVGSCSQDKSEAVDAIRGTLVVSFAEYDSKLVVKADRDAKALHWGGDACSELA